MKSLGNSLKSVRTVVFICKQISFSKKVCKARYSIQIPHEIHVLLNLSLESSCIFTLDRTSSNSIAYKECI